MMSKNLKFFLISLLFSAFFWGGFNVLAISLAGGTNNGNGRLAPQKFSAQVLPQAPPPVIEKAKPEIGAKSVFSLSIDKKGNERIIFEKNPDEILPIASLTKLMTAWVASEYYDPSQVVDIGWPAVDQPEDFGRLKVGETLSVENLLYIMLIESSNDAAYAVAELISEKGFVGLMNIEAKSMGMSSTNFIDTTGYLPENYSTARDLAKLSKYLLIEKPQIWEITKKSEFNLYDADGVFHHTLLSTDELLKEFPQIIGGKTGFTFEAKGCLIIISKDEKSGNTFVNVILGSDDRFGDMRKLIEYEL